MGAVSVSRTMAVPAAKAWRLVGDFSSLMRWHPGVLNFRMQADGRERLFTIAGLGTAHERLETVDEQSMHLSYAAIDLPLPCSGYAGRMSVEEIDEASCIITWSSHFTAVGIPEELLEKGVDQYFSDGLIMLERFLTGAQD